MIAAADKVEVAEKEKKKKPDKINYMLEFVKPAELDCNVIYTISNFIQCDTRYGITWNCIADNNVAVRLSKCDVDCYEDLDSSIEINIFWCSLGRRPAGTDSLTLS